jgi:hypothetical protein
VQLQTLKPLAQHLMMEHFTQGEDILVCLSPAHLLALSEGKNVKIEILGQSQCLTNQSQSLTSYQSTEIMNERTPIQSKELVKPPSNWNQVTMFI